MRSLRSNLVLLVLLIASSAQAQALPTTTTTVVQRQSSAAEPPSPLSHHVDALSVTVSGSVSLGSYEAGKLYFLTDVLCSSRGLRTYSCCLRRLRGQRKRVDRGPRTQTKPESGREAYDVCERARRGSAAPTVDPTFVVADRYRRPSESELDYVLRLLGSYRFEFRDLGLTRSDAFQARLVIRRQSRLAFRQPTGALE